MRKNVRFDRDDIPGANALLARFCTLLSCFSHKRIIASFDRDIPGANTLLARFCTLLTRCHMSNTGFSSAAFQHAHKPYISAAFTPRPLRRE